MCFWSLVCQGPIVTQGSPCWLDSQRALWPTFRQRQTKKIKSRKRPGIVPVILILLFPKQQSHKDVICSAIKFSVKHISASALATLQSPANSLILKQWRVIICRGKFYRYARIRCCSHWHGCRARCCSCFCRWSSVEQLPNALLQWGNSTYLWDNKCSGPRRFSPCFKIWGASVCGWQTLRQQLHLEMMPAEPMWWICKCFSRDVTAAWAVWRLFWSALPSLTVVLVSLLLHRIMHGGAMVTYGILPHSILRSQHTKRQGSHTVQQWFLWNHTMTFWVCECKLRQSNGTSLFSQYHQAALFTH